MSKSVAQVFGRPHRSSKKIETAIDWPNPYQLIGIEIEVDNVGRSGVVLPFSLSSWTRVPDASLRDGTEYRLIQPMSGDQLAQAVTEFFEPPTQVRRSVSSGTHIHINMDEEDTPVTAVQALATLVFVLEPAIYIMADPGRMWGGFTLPMEDADTSLFGHLFVDNIDSSPEVLRRLCETNRTYKYFGLNIQTLGAYGSMEFRYFPTATRVEELVDWISLVQKLKMIALRFPTKESMSNMLEDSNQYERMVREELAPWADRILEVVHPKRAGKRVRKLRSIAALGMDRGEINSSFYNKTLISRNKKYKKFFPAAPNYEDLSEVDDPVSSFSRSRDAFAPDGEQY